MIADLHLPTMRPQVRGILCVFTALTLLSHRITQAVPAPFNVSVTCDSYGVLVTWMTSGLSQHADFLLELRPNHGVNKSVITRYPRYNISSLMEDTEYNRYVARVAARDGGKRSEFAESQIFTYNFLDQLNLVVCDLEFPPVTLFPRDGKLFVKFPNPVHLYRDTPALRNLEHTEALEYVLTSSNDTKITEDCTCVNELDTCECSLKFPEQQEEYCVKLMGNIRKTLVRESGPHCYTGTLYPGPPIATILIPLLACLAAFVLLTLGAVLLVEVSMKRQGEKIFPDFLKDRNVSQLIGLLKPPLEPVDVNPHLEPLVILPDVTCEKEETTTSSCSKSTSGSSGNSGMEGRGYEEGQNGYGVMDEDGDRDEAGQSLSTLSSGYDRPHA